MNQRAKEHRNLIAAVVALLTLGAQAQTVSSSPDQKPGTEFQIVSAGPHQNVWQKTSLDKFGQTNIQSYTEVATGLNFYDPASYGGGVAGGTLYNCTLIGNSTSLVTQGG